MNACTHAAYVQAYTVTVTQTFVPLKMWSPLFARTLYLSFARVVVRVKHRVRVKGWGHDQSCG